MTPIAESPAIVFRSDFQSFRSNPSLVVNCLISPTLNSSLGTNSRSETEGSGHEVGENLVRARGLVGSVFAETGNLQGRLVLVGVAERAIEGGGLGGLRQSSPLLAGGDSSAGGGQLLAGASAQIQFRGGSG